MSFTSPAFGEYGNTFKGSDYSLFWSKNSAVITFEGRGFTSNSGIFLKRKTGSQAIYIPPETFGSIVRVRGFLFDVAAGTAYPLQMEADTYVAFENDGGTISPANLDLTFSGGDVDSDVGIHLLRNTNIDGFEVQVEENSGNQEVYCRVEIEFVWINDTYKALVAPNNFPEAATATLTQDEVPNA